MDELLSNLGLGEEDPPARPAPVPADPSLLRLSSPPLVHAARQTAPPVLVQRTAARAIYRLNDVGFKVILDPNPSEEQILKVLHERKVSNFLPPGCHKRVVKDVISFKRRLALKFEWVHGITLKEWLDKVRNGPPADFHVCLRAAMAVARTLADFHVGGVACNGLAPENIVLAPFQGEYVATFIDLSGYLIFGGDHGGDANMGADVQKKLKEADLRSLGLILCQIFGGEGEGAGGEARDQEGRSRAKRGKPQAPTEGLPVYLGSLISALLDDSALSKARYENARDVFADLKMLAEDRNGPLSKRELDDLTVRSRLRLRGDAFYGRRVEMSMLLSMFKSGVVQGGRPLMATIVGFPGTGKSTLVNQVKKPLTDLNGCFIEGKFNEHVRPDAVLTSALDSFFRNILAANAGNAFMPMKWRIHDAIGSGGDGVLFEVLPNLQKWMTSEGCGGTADEAGGAAPAEGMGGGEGIDASHRLKFLLCKLVNAIACRAHPLVLFLDDLQWADEMTLDIVRMMLTDPEISHFLVLGCYRDNEVNVSHPLMAKLREIQDQGINTISIKIGPIEKESVNKLLSEALCMPPSLCWPLSDVVHSKTGGVILFILRFLASLNDDGDLWFNMSARRWMYNLEEIRLKEIHGDVVSHMTERMKSLPKKMQMGLMLAACLGHKFDLPMLRKVEKDNCFKDTFLESCVDFGFLRNCGSDQYVWAHDQIFQAAYDLIPLQKQESFHLLVGIRLFTLTLPSEMDRMIFYIVDNMNRGSKLIDDVDQKYELSKLNLEAGERAISSSAFHSAANYILIGLSHLGPESWEESRYYLTMRLYDAASEALFVTGDFSRLSQLIDEPMTNARSFEDKLNILNNFVRSLAASSKFEEGISKCIDILCQLGEVIPTNITPDIYAQEVSSLKELLQGKTRQDLLSLPKMSETRKLAAMQFMNHTLVMTFNANPMLHPIIVFRMVKMSIEHGNCNISAFAFACYGAWLVCEPTCDVEGGHKMGRVATEVMKRLGAFEMTPRLFSMVYGFINIWNEPWQAGQSKHLEAYGYGATSGDIEYATTNLYMNAYTALYGCGENLESLSHNIQSYAKRAFQCNQKWMWTAFMILHQLTLDLTGVDQNAFSHFSNETTEDSCLANCLQNNRMQMCKIIWLKKKYGAFLKGDLTVAAKMYDQEQEYPRGSIGRMVGGLVCVFIDGLIGFFFARKHGIDEAKWTNLGLSAIESLSKWAKRSEWNFSNKLHLLKAELYFLRKDDESALASYRASIKAAKDHRFVHEEGLAEEKMATYLLNKNEHDEAMEHFINAKRCYETWGARTLVQRIDAAIAILLPLCNKRC